jgi:L-ascorbate metabolism protein UlaG (beta-lactamase superfamily)
MSVEYRDDTPFGAPMTPKLETNLRSVYRTVLQAVERDGPVDVVRRAPALLQEVQAQEGYLRLLDGPTLRHQVLYPDTNLVKPSALTFTKGQAHSELRLEFHPDLLPVLHDVVAALSGDGGGRLERMPADIKGVHDTVLRELERRDMLVRVPGHEEFDRSVRRQGDATFVGHNTVVVRSDTTQVVIDPWFLPTAAHYPVDYQPVSRQEIGPVDAVLITHAHPDHFDLGSLLQFGSHVKIFVPYVERESLLSVDMALRLRQLGFQDVRQMHWWQQEQVGDIEIAALPFYGEQPTTGEQLCPEVTNAGNVYLCRTARFSCAVLADSGRDRRGDVREVAREAHRRWGPIDVLFAGYRGWSLYPVQYLSSSVRRYLLFVPPDQYGVRQTIMNSAAEAVDTAENWHARYLVPYADGGAPWYWEAGLGPALDADGRKLQECVYFDPFPERCLEELRVRSAPSPNTIVGSPVAPLLLRPGQSVHLRDGMAGVVESARHRWPWDTVLPARPGQPEPLQASVPIS